MAIRLENSLMLGAAPDAAFALHDEVERRVTGKVAQQGRGIMQDVSARLIDQFVASLAKREGVSIASAAPVPAAPAGTDPPTATAPDPEPIDLLRVCGRGLFSRDVLVGAWMVAVLILLTVIASR